MRTHGWERLWYVRCCNVHADRQFSLPSKPSEPDLVSRYPCLRTDSCTDEERTDVIAPDIYWWTRTWRRDYPRAPDPRTDLHYVNLLNKLVQLKPWPKILGLGTRNVIAWHGVKSDEVSLLVLKVNVA